MLDMVNNQYMMHYQGNPKRKISWSSMFLSLDNSSISNGATGIKTHKKIGWLMNILKPKSVKKMKLGLLSKLDQ